MPFLSLQVKHPLENGWKAKKGESRKGDEKVKENLKNLAKSGGIRIETLILGIIMILGNLAPFAHYRYKKHDFTISGFDFMIGKTVSGGKVVISPNILLWIVVVLAAVIIITSLLAPKMKTRINAGIIVLAAIVSVFLNIKFATNIVKILDGAKKTGMSFGTAIPIIAAGVIIVICLRVLAKEKVLSPLDFMLMPGMIYLLINNYIPMFGIYIAFKKVDYSKGIWNSPWVGLSNFKYLFSTSDAWIITRNTLLYNAVFIALGILTGIIVGICLAELFSKGLQKLYQTTILLPQLISMVIVAYIVYGFLSNETGFVNNTILGSADAINFYADKKFWPFILVFVYNWKQLGYNAIIFLSSIVGIDKSLYEAARVDGATKWQQITKITLPQLKPTIITLMLLQVGRIFYSDFGLFYQVPLDSGALYSVTNTVDTYVYRALLVSNNISTASAASTYQAICGFVIVFAVNMIVRKIDKENALF